MTRKRHLYAILDRLWINRGLLLADKDPFLASMGQLLMDREQHLASKGRLSGSRAHRWANDRHISKMASGCRSGDSQVRRSNLEIKKSKVSRIETQPEVE